VSVQEAYRQETFDVKTPPSNGPATDAMPKTAPMRPKYSGLFSSGAANNIKVIEPVNKPDAPIPAIARPQINPTEFGAAPQIAEPTSKTTMSAR